MDAQRKEQIAHRFLEHPMVFMFVRAMLFSVWFRLFVVGVFLVPIVAVLSVPKIWRTSPAGTLPVVRISVIDYIQSYSLRGTARTELGQDRVADAILSYQLALANNRGNATLLREYLNAVLDRVKPPAFQGAAIMDGWWLVHVTGTNSADAVLASRIFEKYGLQQLAADLIGSIRSDLTPDLQAIYLRSLFAAGEMARFDEFYRRIPSSSVALTNVDVQLHRAAFVAGWEPRSPRDGLIRIEDYVGDPKHGETANRLLLRVAEQRSELHIGLAAFQRLETAGQARVLDHISIWRLLASNGRLTDAVQRASAFQDAPVNVIEAGHLAKMLYDLGLKERAIELLDKTSADLGLFDSLWMFYAGLLQETAQWNKLKDLALNLRLNQALAQRLGGFSHYLEGRVALAEHQIDSARTAFVKAAEEGIMNFDIAVRTARGMLELGYPREALRLLSHLESDGVRDPLYWELMVALAFELKEAEMLLRSATTALKLNPASWALRNNYAAALLINRHDPNASVKLTFELMNEVPNVASVLINHSLALVQNARFDEAEKFLAKVPVDKLNESEQSYYRMAMTEALARQGKSAQAREVFQKIDARFLFPTQRQHLESVAATLK